ADPCAGREGFRERGTLMSATPASAPASVYGLLAEFDTPTALVTATKRVYADGYRRIDTFSPFPIEEAWEAMHVHDRRLSPIVLAGGILGLLSGARLQLGVANTAS